MGHIAGRTIRPICPQAYTSEHETAVKETGPYDYGKLATSILDEVDNLEKVYKK